MYIPSNASHGKGRTTCMMRDAVKAAFTEGKEVAIVFHSSQMFRYAKNLLVECGVCGREWDKVGRNGRVVFAHNLGGSIQLLVESQVEMWAVGRRRIEIFIDHYIFEVNQYQKFKLDLLLEDVKRMSGD